MDNGHTSGAAVVGAVVSLTSLAGVAVVMRLITRMLIVRKPGVDDICITLAIAFSIVQGICMVLQVNYGLGRHMSELSGYNRTHTLIFMWASIWPYYAALGFAKCSILIQYLRFFPHRAIRNTCYIMIGICVTFYLSATMTAVFACMPISYFWDQSQHGKCLNRTAVWFTNATMNILTDFIIALLPLPVVKSLHLPKPQKIVLGVVFGLAGLTCIISVLRLQSLYVISKATDITYKNPLAAIWTCAELNCCILCSCIPTLKGCVGRVFPNLLGTVTSHHALPELQLSKPSTRASATKAQRRKVDGDIHVTAFDQPTDNCFGQNQAQAPSDDTYHLVKYTSYPNQSWGYNVKCESRRPESDDL